MVPATDREAAEEYLGRRLTAIENETLVRHGLHTLLCCPEHPHSAESCPDEMG